MDQIEESDLNINNTSNNNNNNTNENIKNLEHQEEKEIQKENQEKKYSIIPNISEAHKILKKQIQTKSDKFKSILKLFGKKLFLFTSLRSLINLIKLLIKIKMNLKKIDVQKLLDIIFDWGNLKSGLFLSIMPLIYSLLTEIIFDLDEEKNILKQKALVFLSGFLCALVGISFAEKFKLFNYVILSVMVRSLHSWLFVYLKKNNKKTDEKSWSYLVFWLACCGFLFMTYYHPGFKPIRKLYFRYAFFDGNEKNEVKNFISRTNLVKKAIKK